MEQATSQCTRPAPQLCPTHSLCRMPRPCRYPSPAAASSSRLSRRCQVSAAAASALCEAAVMMSYSEPRLQYSAAVVAWKRYRSISTARESSACRGKLHASYSRGSKRWLINCSSCSGNICRSHPPVRMQGGMQQMPRNETTCAWVQQGGQHCGCRSRQAEQHGQYRGWPMQCLRPALRSACGPAVELFTGAHPPCPLH